MKKNRIGLLYLATLVLGVGTMALVGCGGGGGPISKTGAPSGPQSPSAAFTALLPAGQAKATDVGNAKCAPCHAAEATSLTHTMHALQNVTCENCHGPGSVHVAAGATQTAAIAATNILTWPNVSRDTVCAQCHGPEDSDWSSSFHAQFVADPVDSGSNNCLRCHSAEMRDQYIETPLAAGETPTQIDAAIVALPASVLGTGPTGFGSTTHATASCVTCHEPMALTAAANDPTYGALAGTNVHLRRMTSNTTPPTSADIGAGASTASYTTYNQVCGTCHNARGGDGSDASVAKESSRINVHEGPEMNMLLGQAGSTGGGAGDLPSTSDHVNVPDQCIHCHMPNSSHTFTVKLDVSCAPCHTAADAAARESSVQGTVLSELLALQTEMSQWAVAQGYMPDQWDYSSNWAAGETKPAGYTIPIVIARARHNYGFIINDRSYGIHNWVYTQTLLNLSLQQVGALPGVTPVTPAVSPGQSVSGAVVAQLKAQIAPEVAKEAAGAGATGD